MSSMTLFLLILLAVDTAALVAMSILYRKAKKAGKVRRVEGPNSQYKSPYVIDLETKDRWESMDLDGLHEVNREEVEKVLGKVRAVGVRGLSTAERDFLDRMADASGRVRGRGRSAGPHPRPRQLPRPS